MTLGTPAITWRALATVAIGAGVALGSAPAATAAPSTTTLQIPALGLDDCPSGCVPVFHDVLVTVGTAPGVAIVESTRGSGTLHWRNLQTGATGAVTLSWDDTGRTHEITTGAGLVHASFGVDPGVWTGVGVFLVM